MIRNSILITLLCTFSLPVWSEQSFNDLIMRFGKPDAPVTIITPHSQVCPYVRNFRVHILPKLEKKYISTGKVQIISMPFPLNDDDLELLKISHCDAQKTALIQDALFKRQRIWGSLYKKFKLIRGVEFNRVARIVDEKGLSVAEQKRCMADKTIEQQLLKSSLALRNLYGAFATPTYIIDDHPYHELNWDDFDWLITKKLNKKK